MKVIGKKVWVFLDEYKNTDNIKNNLPDFKSSLYHIISTLLIRIESEEERVYLYW